MKKKEKEIPTSKKQKEKPASKKQKATPASKKQKATSASKKKKNEPPLNKKKQKNKVLKAKSILAKNREAIHAASEKRDAEIKRSTKCRVLQIIKRIFFGILIAVLAVALVSFILIRVKGDTPTVFGYSIQRVTSGSMEPTLMVGDIIVSKDVESPDEIDIDDIVTFKGGSDFEYNNVTHRVVVPPMKNIDGDYVLTTKGDANERADNEIYYDDVRSKFVTKLDFLNHFFDFFLSPWGLIIFILLLLVIFFDEILTIAKVITGNYEEDEEDEEEESLREIMKRIKEEEEEEKRKEEELRAHKRKNWRKFDNTSKRKQKNRKKNKNDKRVNRLLDD